MIRTFLFDMGNVLVHFSHDLMCAQMGTVCALPAAEIEQFLFGTGLQLEFERGQHTEREFHQKFEELVGCKIDFDALRLAGCDIFQLNAPLVPVLDALKARGHRLVLLSNTSLSHFEFVRDHFPVLDYFDDFVVSYQVGAVKPEPEIFEAALKKIDCAPHECFYTDDIPDYVETARNFGLQAELFVDSESLAEHLRRRGIAPIGNG